MGAVAVVVQVVLRRRVSQLVVVRFGSLLKYKEEFKVFLATRLTCVNDLHHLV